MQCENHSTFFQICLDSDWLLWESGTDTTCTNFPEHVPIWLRPCPWDTDQKEPVGCLCCTNLEQGLVQFHREMKSWLESRLMELDPDWGNGRPFGPEFSSLRERAAANQPGRGHEPLGPPSRFLPPYRPM